MNAPAHMLALMVSLLCASAWAQNNNFVEPPPWQELTKSPPDQFDLGSLIPIDNPTLSNLDYGVIPGSIDVGADKVVRYVVVAANRKGAKNVMYEGVRCDTREVKTYAYWRADSGWRTQANAQWRALRYANSRYAQILANDGFCDVNIVFGSAEEMVQRLRQANRLNR